MNVIQIIALVLFLIMYALMLVFSEKRPYITSGAAIIFIILMIVNFSTNQDHTFWEAVNATGVQAFTDFSSWNVLLMIAGTMGVVAFFIESKMPSLMADVIINKVPNVKWAIVSLSLFAGLVSAFIDNVATVPVSYTHLRAHETPEHLVCRLLLEKKKPTNTKKILHTYTLSTTYTEPL